MPFHICEHCAYETQDPKKEICERCRSELLMKCPYCGKPVENDFLRALRGEAQDLHLPHPVKANAARRGRKK
jgi:predicted amidophosphoribosyltransferase